jgi:hypothetical protein
MGGKGVNVITLVPPGSRTNPLGIPVKTSPRILLEALLPLCNIHATDFCEPIPFALIVTIEQIYTTCACAHRRLSGIEVA